MFDYAAAVTPFCFAWIHISLCISILLNALEYNHIWLLPDRIYAHTRIQNNCD